MPRLSFDTNVPAFKIPQDFLSECTKILSASMKKPHAVSPK